MASHVPRAHASRAQATTAALEGLVRSVGGAALPGAQVEIRSRETGAYRRAATDGAGSYHLFGLSPGAYDVIARAIGTGPSAATRSDGPFGFQFSMISTIASPRPYQVTLPGDPDGDGNFGDDWPNGFAQPDHTAGATGIAMRTYVSARSSAPLVVT